MKLQQLRYVAYFNSAAILGNLIGIIRAKLTTLWFGIAGVGVLGQILTFFNLQTRVIDLGVNALLNNRVGKLRPEEQAEEYPRLIAYALLIILISNLISLALILTLSREVSNWLFGDESYRDLVVLLAFINPIFTAGYFLQELVRAHKNFRRLALGQNLAHAVGILSVVPCLKIWGIEGIIYNFYCYLGFSVLFFLPAARPYLPRLRLADLRIRWPQLYEIIRFCFSNTLRNVLVYFSLILLRVLIVQFTSLEENGLFQSFFSISNYINILSNAFIIYLFPTLSGMVDKHRFNRELNLHFEYLLYLIFPFIAAIMLFPEFFIRLFYDRSFIAMSYPLTVFAFLKLFEGIYMFFSIAFLSATRLRFYIWSEIIHSLLLVGGAYGAIRYFHLEGAIWSFTATKLLAFLVVMLMLTRDERFHLSPQNRQLLLKMVLLLAIMLIPASKNMFYRTGQSLIFVAMVLAVLDWKKYYRLIRRFFPGKAQR